MAFDSTRRPVLALLAGVTGAGLLAAAIAVPAAQAAPDRSSTSTLAELVVGTDPVSGEPERVSAPVGRPLARPNDVPSGASDTTVARAHLDDIAPLWGIDTDASSLRALTTAEVDGVGPVVRFAQLVDGVPVFGGQFVVALDDSGDLLTVAGSTADKDDASFTVTATTAANVARATAATKLKLAAATLRVGTPRQYVYDPTLLGDTGAARSAWRVVVAGPKTSAQKVEVFVDATNGKVLNAFGATEALSLGICDGDNDFLGDASYGWCGENAPNQRPRDTNYDGRITGADALDTVQVPYARIDSASPSGVADVNKAYEAMSETAKLYSNDPDPSDPGALGTEGFDLGNAIGMTDAAVGNTTSVTPNTRRLAGVVQYCDPPEYFFPYLDYGDAYDYADSYCPYDNAYWSDSDFDWTIGDGAYPGGQMFIGAGLADSADVIGHELTHGVTSATNGLIYYKESGAINESMSDVFGQLTQVYANPSADPAWLMGDGLEGGAIRSMSNPATTSLWPNGRQPDTMTSSLWDLDKAGYDAGGVHTNSGVGNKAAYLIANGGTFGGVKVNRLDLTSAARSKASTAKVAKLYWATQQNLLPNANYRRLAETLYSTCVSLVGTNGFTAADCSGSVRKAVEATRMTLSKASVTASKKSVTPGKSAVITTRVGDARNTARGGAVVKLQKRLAGSSSWTTVGSGGTSSAGTRAWTVKPTRSTYYRAVVSSSGVISGATSGSVLVALKPTISKAVTGWTINYGKSFKVKGKVNPKLKGKTVWLQRYSSGKWRTVKKDKLSSKSVYAFKYRPKSHADLKYRVYLPGATTYASGTSAKFRIAVR